MEIQIRGLNRKQSEKITDLLFMFLYGSNRPDAYKNEFGEQVTEFEFAGFNREKLKEIRGLFEDE